MPRNKEKFITNTDTISGAATVIRKDTPYSKKYDSEERRYDKIPTSVVLNNKSRKRVNKGLASSSVARDIKVDKAVDFFKHNIKGK